MTDEQGAKDAHLASLTVRDHAAVKSALRQLQNLSALSEHPLADLCLVKQRLSENRLDADVYRRGRSLQEVLQDAVKELKPEGEENEIDERWRHYIVVREFLIKKRNRNAVAGVIGLSVGRTSDQVTEAVDRIVSILYLREEQCRTKELLSAGMVEDTVLEEPVHRKTDNANANRSIPQRDHSVSTVIERLLPNSFLWRKFKSTQTATGTYLAVAIIMLIPSALGVIFWQYIQNSVGVANRWCDNFEQPSLDTQKWELVEDEAGLIYVDAGKLNFKAAPPEKSEIVGAELALLPSGEAIREITFTATLISSIGAEPASAGARLFLQNGQDFAVMLGSGSEGPEVELYKCPHTVCNDEYERYQTNRLPVAVGKPILTQIINKENLLSFNVGALFHEEVPVDAQLNRFLFSMFAEPGSTFHVAVDDVCVVYAK